MEPERTKGMEAMADDVKFDLWMQQYQQKMTKKPGSGNPQSQQSYIRNHARVYGDG